jgi:hypothetical protein
MIMIGSVEWVECHHAAGSISSRLDAREACGVSGQVEMRITPKRRSTQITPG